MEASIINLAWTIGTSATETLYIGLEAQVVEIDGSTSVIDWTDTGCTMEYCDHCHRSSDLTVAAVVICFLLAIPPILTTYKRASRTRDQHFHKVRGIFLPVLSMITSMIALENFTNECYYYLPYKDSMSSDITWVVGPGSMCLVFAVVLKPIDIILHILVPVVKGEDEQPDDDNNVSRESMFSLQV